jgi:hypothetical protein
MKKVWLRMAISMLAIACLSGSVFAQVPAKEPVAVKEVTKMSVKGKIVYSTTMKRYVIRGRGEVYGIANQNAEILDQLAKGKQTVTVEGHIVGGDSLFIEKIDGAPYKGVKEPGSK